MIGIIKYGMGNLASIQNALNYLQIDNEIFSDPRQIHKYDKLILPGVGAFGSAMENLDTMGFTPRIKEVTVGGEVPLLGICLGMQLLFESSMEYGYHKGLGLIEGVVLFLGERISNLPLPHVGWNDLLIRPGSRLLKGLPTQSSFYFVHNFYCSIVDESVVAGTTEYGFPFATVVDSGNIFGCQFHPEKSQKHGLMILGNFGDMAC